MITRYCPRCKQDKPLTEFKLRLGYPENRPHYQPYCLSYRRQINAAYYRLMKRERV